MKVLLFITGCRHLEEYHYFNLFIKNLKLNHICDIFIYCNNPDISPEIVKYYKEFENQNKHLFITTVNGGYRIGGVEAVSNGIEMGIFKDYDYVIHLHPDVFITEDEPIIQLLEENLTNDIVFFITKSVLCFSMFDFDFFIFKPKLLTKNIFKDDLYKFTDNPEQYLRNMILSNEIKYIIIKRFENDHYEPRRIDDHLKLYHEHDLEKVKKVCQDKNYI